MSDLASKLETPRGTPGVARATYAQLERRWGELSELSDDLLRFDGMHPNQPEFWRRIAGSWDKGLFEMVAAP